MTLALQQACHEQKESFSCLSFCLSLYVAWPHHSIKWCWMIRIPVRTPYVSSTMRSLKQSPNIRRNLNQPGLANSHDFKLNARSFVLSHATNSIEALVTLSSAWLPTTSRSRLAGWFQIELTMKKQKYWNIFWFVCAAWAWAWAWCMFWR